MISNRNWAKIKEIQGSYLGFPQLAFNYSLIIKADNQENKDQEQQSRQHVIITQSHNNATSSFSENVESIFPV